MNIYRIDGFNLNTIKGFYQFIRNSYQKKSKICITTDLNLSNDLKHLTDQINENFKIKCYLSPSFDKWINLIDQSNIVITAEKDVTYLRHSEQKSIIIYDKQNKPEFIMKEYKPYKIENLVQIKSDIGEKLNNKIISSLNQL